MEYKDTSHKRWCSISTLFPSPQIPVGPTLKGRIEREVIYTSVVNESIRRARENTAGKPNQTQSWDISYLKRSYGKPEIQSLPDRTHSPELMI